MQIRMLQPGEEMQLARMKWLHCQEDDRDYGEHNLDGADYATFAAEFTAFLRAHPEYRVYVAVQGDTLAAAMFVYVIPKVPKPGGHAQSIAYLTNVYTLPEWRNPLSRRWPRSGANCCLPGPANVRCPGMRATASAPKMRSWSARSRPNDYSRRWPSVHTACTRMSLSISRMSASLPASSEPLRACMPMLRAGVSAAQCTA